MRDYLPPPEPRAGGVSFWRRRTASLKKARRSSRRRISASTFRSSSCSAHLRCIAFRSCSLARRRLSSSTSSSRSGFTALRHLLPILWDDADRDPTLPASFPVHHQQLFAPPNNTPVVFVTSHVLVVRHFQLDNQIGRASCRE